MRNQTFTKKTADEKRRHLASVLRNGTCGALDDGMIGRILPIVFIHKQYAISVFSDNRTFLESVARAQTGKSKLSIVSSPARHGPVAAVVAPVKASGAKNRRWAICVYAPGRQDKKGGKEWAKPSKNG